MAALTEAHESRIAANRSKTRQNKAVPWLIRGDGMITPNVPLIAKKNNFRPYHGALDASLEERMKYLAGMQSRGRKVVYDQPAEPEPFDISRATKEELIQFAVDEYTEVIEPETHLNKVRSIVCSLAGLEYSKVFGVVGAPATGLAKD